MTQEFSSKVPARNLSQPDARTCQATCIAMVTNEPILSVRAGLEALGEPGDPYVMGEYLRVRAGKKYNFEDNACLNDVKAWLKSGEFLVCHGFWTGAGHVIALDGVAIDSKTLSYKISVKDPWSEFNAKLWAYDNPSIDFYDGYYSSYLMYAAIVASSSVSHARDIYSRGELDSNREGAWVHRIKP